MIDRKNNIVLTMSLLVSQSQKLPAWPKLLVLLTRLTGCASRAVPTATAGLFTASR